jgi:hypothetical protein
MKKGALYNIFTEMAKGEEINLFREISLDLCKSAY